MFTLAQLIKDKIITREGRNIWTIKNQSSTLHLTNKELQEVLLDFE